MRRLLAAAAVTGALVGVAAAPAYADPATLAVSGLHQANDTLEFYLAARDLPPGTAFDNVVVTVRADSVDLPTKVSVATGTSTDRSTAPRRVSVLVLDTSGSMAGAPLASAKQAALTYAQALPADVQVGLVTVADTATVALPPTADRAALAAAVDAMAAKGSTALYDGVLAGTKILGASTTAEEQRRVLVLSDGADTASHTSLAQMSTGVAGSHAVVDAVAFHTNAATAKVLQDLATPTGGHAYSVSDGATLATTFRAAAGSFSSQLAVSATIPASLAGKDTRLEITARVGATTITTSAPVSFDVDPNAPTARGVVTVHRSALVWYAIIGGLVFLALLAFGLVLFAPMIDYARHRRRVAQVDQFRLSTPVTSGRVDADRSLAQAALAVSERVVRSRGWEGRIARQLDRAGMRIRPHEWLLIRFAVAACGAVLLSLVTLPLAGFTGGLLPGLVATGVYLRIRIDRRMQRFAAQLPDALQLVIGSVRSGFSLSQAIDAMAREASDPISTEFSRALAEARLGADLEDALSRIAGRMGSKDLAWAVVAIRVQGEVGGNLAEVLSTTVSTMRERESLRRHVRALAAEGRLSAYILIALPVLVALWLLITRPGYLAPLVTTPVGLLMLLAGVVLMGLGSFWMSRVIKVEV